MTKRTFNANRKLVQFNLRLHFPFMKFHYRCNRMLHGGYWKRNYNNTYILKMW